MKVKIGVSSPIDCESIEVDGPVLKAYGPAAKGKVLAQGPLLLAYHLHPGEMLRANFSNKTEVIFEVTQ